MWPKFSNSLLLSLVVCSSRTVIGFWMGLGLVKDALMSKSSVLLAHKRYFLRITLALIQEHSVYHYSGVCESYSLTRVAELSLQQLVKREEQVLQGL